MPEQTKPFTTGTKVRQIAPVISGSVEDARYDAVTGEMSYLVAYTADGEPAQRWFAAHELEAA